MTNEQEDTVTFIFALLGHVVLASIVFYFGSLIYKASFVGSTGKVDYCWVDYVNNGASNNVTLPSNVVYRLRGHIDWRADEDIAVFSSFDEAVAGAAKIDCPLRAK